MMRMNTSQLASDGLLARLSEKVEDTQRKISMQDNSIRRISRNVEVLTPVHQRKPYVVPSDSPQLEFGPDSNIELR